MYDLAILLQLSRSFPNVNCDIGLHIVVCATTAGIIYSYAMCMRSGSICIICILSIRNVIAAPAMIAGLRLIEIVIKCHRMAMVSRRVC